MSLPRVVSRAEWRAARVALLEKEKELTRARDALNVERRNLPMVEVDTEYVFDGPDGRVTLADIFEGRPQLIIYHFMFHPEWEEGCPSCTAGTDELSEGFFDHLHTRDTTYAMVSRAPLEKLDRWKANDPIDKLERALAEGADIGIDDLAATRQRGRKAVAEALERALTWPEPSAESRFDYVWAVPR